MGPIRTRTSGNRPDRQIPGALGFELEPPPQDARPDLSPGEVLRRYPADGGKVWITFASVRDRLAGRSIGPAWVLFARGVCLRDSKGELVSDARGNDPNNLECTDATIWNPRGSTPRPRSPSSL